MSDEFDLISSLHERGHLAQVVTKILTLIDDERFVRTVLRLVSKSWRRIVEEDDFFWHRLACCFRNNDQVYEGLHRRLSSHASAYSKDDDEDRLRPFHLHLETLRHKKLLSTNWREWNWRRSSVDNDESLDLLVHDETHDLVFAGDLAGKLVCYDVADGILTPIAEWNGRATRRLVGGWVMKSTICWRGFLICPTYRKELVFVAIKVNSNRQSDRLTRSVSLAAVTRVTSWTGPEFARPLFAVGEATMEKGSCGLFAVARLEQSGEGKEFKMESFRISILDGDLQTEALGSSVAIEDVWNLQTLRVNKDGSVCLICQWLGAPCLIVFSSFGERLKTIFLSSPHLTNYVVVERRIILADKDGFLLNEWPLRASIAAGAMDREPVRGVVTEAFPHPFEPALVYHDQFRFNLWNLANGEKSESEMDFLENCHVACVHQFGILARIDDGSSSVIMHLSFV